MKKYRYIEGVDKTQQDFIGISLDDMIDKNDYVRVINKIVDEMDIIKLNFKYSITSKTGRKPYHPKDMLKIYIFCYFNKIRSSRRMEQECKQNIKLMWLVGKLTPDFKTIADFRKNNKEGIENVFVDFVLLCKSLGLIGGNIIAVDGSKFKANNSTYRCHTKNKVQKMIDDTKSQIEEYIKILDENDRRDKKNRNITFSKKEIKMKLNNLKIEMQNLEKLKIEVKEEGSIATTDSDCKLMRMSSNALYMAYNVQSAIDNKNYIAVAVDATNECSDYAQLHNISSKAKQNINKEKITVLADSGYNSAEQFAKCENDNIEVLVNTVKNQTYTPDKNYGKDNFIYNSKDNTYTCPQNNILYATSKSNSVKKCYTNPSACKRCHVLSKCSIQKYRIIERRKFEDYVVIVKRRTKKKTNIFKKRKAIVEHGFGDVKYNLGYHYFLTRGRLNILTETYLHFLIYNLKRFINILGATSILRY